MGVNQELSWEDWKAKLIKEMLEYGWETEEAKAWISDDESTFLSLWKSGKSPASAFQYMAKEEGCAGDCEDCGCVDNYWIEDDDEFEDYDDTMGY